MPPLKTIEYRGGLLRFRIPSAWQEEYEEDGGGTFYAPTEPSGTLRLSVLTFEGPSIPGGEELLAAVSRHGTPELLPTGNAIASYQSTEKEDGVPITLFFWELANGVAPRHLRLAVFSYTVDTAEADSSRIQADVALLDTEIRAAVFADILGTAADEADDDDEPSVSAPQAADLERLAARRALVERYLPDEAARKQYETTPGKLGLLRALLEEGVFRPDQSDALEAMGVVFGDALAQELGLRWVVVEDKLGRDPALSVEGTSILLYPLTMIAKRVEAGETVDPFDLLKWTAEKIEELR